MSTLWKDLESLKIIEIQEQTGDQKSSEWPIQKSEAGKCWWIFVNLIKPVREEIQDTRCLALYLMTLVAYVQ